jgi:fibronectin type III domain protein
MTTRTSLLRQPRWLLAAMVLVPLLMLALQGLTFQAKAADLDWVDGGDDQLCLQDDTGAALSHPEIEQCAPIIGCETGETNGRAWIRFPTRNGVWQPKGEYADYLVLYGNEQPPSATPTPTPTPTASPTPSTSPNPGTSTPTPGTSNPTTPATGDPGDKPTKGAGGKPGGKPSTSPTPGVTTPPVASDADDLGLDEDEEVVAGAPTAPAAPTVTVDGKDVTVTWAATADAELEGVTGYVLRFSGADPVETDAATTSHTFTGLADGNYRAAVRAVNQAGESPSSPPSDVATVGAPITEVLGSVTVEGDLTPGATVTLTGAGYAPNVPELVLELHSTPVQIGAVATDQTGGFVTTVTLPADVEPGEHHVVVLYDGTEITSTAVQLVAAAVDAATEDVAAAEPAETVPPQIGVLILAALAALGFAALGWHLLSGRRRRRLRLDRGGGRQLPVTT